jgi:hypothetical protein
MEYGGPLETGQYLQASQAEVLAVPKLPYLKF